MRTCKREPRTPAHSPGRASTAAHGAPHRRTPPADATAPVPAHDFSRIATHPPAIDQASGALPSAVRDVLGAGGEPLAPDTRTFVEQAFGHDFGQVRVHHNRTASESARSLEASAYTVGQHIVFGAGQFAPASAHGQRLLAHELTHVVQQQRSPAVVRAGMSTTGDAHERQADAVAARWGHGALGGLLQGVGGRTMPAVQRQTAPPATPPPSPAPPPAPAVQPLDYDTQSVNLELLDPKQSAANLTGLLNDKVKAGEITSFAVTGVRAGTNAEIFLLELIYHLGKRGRWGTEADLVTAIDWPAKPGGAPPQGRVTLRITAKGAATAELIAAGPVPAVAQSTFADGVARLKADFGFAAVTGWPGTSARRDAAEVSDVLAALVLLRGRASQDVAALRGVELIRVPSLGGNTAGEFSMGGGANPGATTQAKPFLKLADRAFSADDVQFVGGGPGSPTVPASFQTILHEVGHAVEKEDLRKAREGVAAASATVDAAQQQLADEGKNYDAERDEAKRKGTLGRFYKERAATHKKNEEAEAKASAGLQAAQQKMDDTMVPAATVQPLENEAAARKTAAANALAAGRTTVQGLRADEVQGSAAYVRTIEATSAAIATFVLDAKVGRATMDDLELAVYQAMNDRDRARFELMKVLGPETRTHRAIFPLDPAVAAQDAWFEAERAVARGRVHTRRLEKFITIVTTNNIRRFTGYAVSNWPLKPEEFFAEAYSLWLADPNFLKTNYGVVFDFFESGDYRK